MDSNHRPEAYETSALPPELLNLLFQTMGQAGIEPATSGLKDRYSDQLSYWPQLMRPGLCPRRDSNPDRALIRCLQVISLPCCRLHHRGERDRRDSNPQSSDRQSDALTSYATAPYRTTEWETGIRTPICRFRVCRPAVRRSPIISMLGWMTGIEPATSGATNRRAANCATSTINRWSVVSCFSLLRHICRPDLL